MNCMHFRTAVLFFCIVVSVAFGEKQRTVPDFSGTDIHGCHYNLYDLLDEGKFVWVHFTGKF